MNCEFPEGRDRILAYSLGKRNYLLGDRIQF